MIKHQINQFNLIWFDPGGTTGWAHLVLDFKAFSRPEHLVLPNVLDWDCGEFTGPEAAQCASALTMVWSTINNAAPLRPKIEVGSESFDLRQSIGGRELLGPVRINAVLEFNILVNNSLTLVYQAPSERTVVSPERLRRWFAGRWPTKSKGKDATAAMQHAVTRLRKLKEKSKRAPWKLENGTTTNAYWDCSCHHKRAIYRGRHDLVHP